jgi:tetratricopeptide (TPR) repeat protein
MYLPVAAVMTLLVLAIHARYGRRGLVLVALLALVFGLLTYRRNFDYRDSLAIWGDAVAHEPGSVTGRLGVGDAFLADHRPAEALQQFDAALILAPDFPATHVDRGVALFQLGRSVEAMAEFERGLALDPGQPGAHASFAEVLGKMGRVSEAIGQDRAALQIEPGFPPAEKNLAQLQAAPRP